MRSRFNITAIETTLYIYIYNILERKMDLLEGIKFLIVTLRVFLVLNLKH